MASLEVLSLIPTTTSGFVTHFLVILQSIWLIWRYLSVFSKGRSDVLCFGVV